MRRRHVLRAHRRVRVLWIWVIGCKGPQIRPISAKELEIQPIRTVLPTRDNEDCDNDTCDARRQLNPGNNITKCGAQRKRVCLSGDTDTSDNFRSCYPGVFNSGATYRLELQCYHLAGKSERKKKQQQPQQQQQQGIINVVQCKGGHPFVDTTEGPTRPLVYMKGKIPSEYYLLRSETLQDIAMNAMFNNYGCGHDDLPPPLQRMYHNHIYI